MINKDKKLNYIKSVKKYQVGDKVKQYRDDHPILDFLAGFIPGVGEAQDAQDFMYSAKNKNLGGMALASLGLIIPGLTGGQIGKALKLSKMDDLTEIGGLGKISKKSTKVKKVMDEPLPDKFKQNGWTVAEDGAFINKNGQRFIRDKKTGRLMSEDSFNIQAKNRKNAKDLLDDANIKNKEFNKIVDEFEEAGLDFSLQNWEALAKGHKMTDTEKYIYKTQALPNFLQTYKELSSQKKLIKKNGKWYGYFDTPVSSQISDKLPILKQKWSEGLRELQGEEGAMMYIITNSPQGKGKFAWNGITMHEGVPEKYLSDFVSGRNKQAFKKWFDSNIAGAPAYSNPDKLKGTVGLQYYGLPIRPSLLYPKMGDEVKLIKRQTVNPSSNNWNGAGQPIGSFISKNPEKKINMSEGPLRDDLASKYNNSDVNGVFTIVGEDIPVKSAFGGTGMYNIEGANLFKPFASIALPLGFGYKLFKNDNKTE